MAWRNWEDNPGHNSTAAVWHYTSCMHVQYNHVCKGRQLSKVEWQCWSQRTSWISSQHDRSGCLKITNLLQVASCGGCAHTLLYWSGWGSVCLFVFWSVSSFVCLFVTYESLHNTPIAIRIQTNGTKPNNFVSAWTFTPKCQSLNIVKAGHMFSVFVSWALTAHN